MSLLRLLVARSPGAAIGTLVLVAGAVAWFALDSLDVELVDEDAGAGNRATSGQDGSGGKGAVSSAAGSAPGMPPSADGAPVSCTGPRTELTLDGTHWMRGECNDYDIQGGWYCVTDDIADEDCDEVAGPRWDRVELGYCLSGTTIVDADLKAWGATLAFELQNAPNFGKASYDAAAHGIVGFDITVQGITSGVPLRVAFAPTVTGGDPSPFVEFRSLEYETRTLSVLIEDAQVPPEWAVATAGDVPDPHALGDVQLQVVGSRREAPYQFCITAVVPIVGDRR